MARGADGGAAEQGTDNKFAVIPPQVALPKGGGAIRGIGEKFAANPATGTGSMTVPLRCVPGDRVLPQNGTSEQTLGCFYTVDISCTDASGSDAYGIYELWPQSLY